MKSSHLNRTPLYCSVLNNRPLLIIIRGEFQAIETQYSAEQYPCSISKLIKSGIKDTKPKFEQSRTKTVDFRRNWNFVQANVPNKNPGFLLRTLEYIMQLALKSTYYERDQWRWCAVRVDKQIKVNDNEFSDNGTLSRQDLAVTRRQCSMLLW